MRVLNTHAITGNYLEVHRSVLNKKEHYQILSGTLKLLTHQSVPYDYILFANDMYIRGGK